MSQRVVACHVGLKTDMETVFNICEVMKKNETLNCYCSLICLTLLNITDIVKYQLMLTLVG